MTEQDKQPESGETPPPEKTQQAKPAAKADKPRQKRRGAVGYLLWILLIVLASAGAAGYYGYQYYLKQQNRLDTIASEQQSLQNANRQLQQQLADSQQSLRKQQTNLANDIQTLSSQNRFLRKDWLVNEAEYLLQLANNRLLFSRDVKTAIVALQAADERLRETGDPGLTGVRKAIAESVQALKSVPQVDVTGMSLTMSALAKDMISIPLNTPEPSAKIKQQISQKSATSQVKSWSELPAAVWRDLKSLIVIRHHDRPVEPLLPPEQRFFLTENLRLQIEQARMAMLSGNEAIYSARLAAAIHWIEKYFDPAAAQTKAALNTLKQLQATNIAPALPQISKPYRLLEAYRQQQKLRAQTK